MPASRKSHKTATRNRKSQPDQRHAKSASKPVLSARKPEPTLPRYGTKLAKVVALLSRKNGATVKDLSTATGRQAHSIRGAISGTLKKKLGLTIESSATDDRARVYRITGRT